MWICKLVSVLLSKYSIGRAARWVIPPLNEDMYMWITWNMGSIPTGDRKNIPLPQFFLRIMVYVDRSVLCSTVNSSFVQLGWYCLLNHLCCTGSRDVLRNPIFPQATELPPTHMHQHIFSQNVVNLISVFAANRWMFGSESFLHTTLYKSTMQCFEQWLLCYYSGVGELSGQ